MHQIHSQLNGFKTLTQNTGAWAQASRATTFPEAPEEKRGGEPAATQVELGTCPKTSLVERIVQLVQGRDQPRVPIKLESLIKLLRSDR